MLDSILSPHVLLTDCHVFAACVCHVSAETSKTAGALAAYCREESDAGRTATVAARIDIGWTEHRGPAEAHAIDVLAPTLNAYVSSLDDESPAWLYVVTFVDRKLSEFVAEWLKRKS